MSAPLFTPTYQWQTITPPASPAQALMDRQILEIVYGPPATPEEEAQMIDLFSATEWAEIVARWKVIAHAQYDYLNRFPDELPNERERKAWRNRLLWKTPRIFATALAVAAMNERWGGGQ